MPSQFGFGKNIFNVIAPLALILINPFSYMKGKKSKQKKTNQKNLFFILFFKCYQLSGKYLLYSEKSTDM